MKKFQQTKITLQSGLKVFSLLSLVFLLLNCYSFTGSSLSPETKTIEIRDFPNNAPLMNASLSQEFSTADRLVMRCVSVTLHAQRFRV